MRKTFLFLVGFMTVICGAAYGQQTTSPVIVVGLPGHTYAPDAIVIPPHTSEKVSLSLGMSSNQTLPAGDKSARKRIAAAMKTNGIVGIDMQPWHLKVAFEEFDSDGDQVNSGTFEEDWAAKNKDVQIFSSKLLTHADYSTEKGVFREGDQHWPNKLESQIKSLILEPFSAVTPVSAFRFIHEVPPDDKEPLDCEVVLAKFGDFGMPHSYCFIAGTNALRYRQGPSWDQVTYNNIQDFDGFHIAREIQLTDGGVPRLKLTVMMLEKLPSTDDIVFHPPSDAMKLGDSILTGVQTTPVHMEFPEWPSKARNQHFTITVEVVIGFDGHVESAKAISGPSEFYKAAEKTASKWTFKPYLIQGKAAKVMTRIELNEN